MAELVKLYKKIFWSMMYSGFIAVFFFFHTPTKWVGAILFASLLLLCLYIIRLLYKAIGILPLRLPIDYFLGGAFLVLGGACFDVAATITYSPDLKLEANPFVLFFLQSQLPLQQIYYISAFGQILYVTIVLVFWATFLKSYPVLLKELSPSNVLKTFLTIFGGPNTTAMDLFLGRVNYFYYINSVVPIILSFSIYRWYLALEWLGWVSISRIIVPSFLCISALSFYVGLSHWLIGKNRGFA